MNGLRFHYSLFSFLSFREVGMVCVAIPMASLIMVKEQNPNLVHEDVCCLL